MARSELLAAIPKRRVLVVGDAILDLTYDVRPVGPSNENQSVTVYVHERDEVSFGGASLVVRNLLALGARVDFLSVFGRDGNLHWYERFRHPHLQFDFSGMVDDQRRNTVKVREKYNHQLVHRLDFRDDRDIPPSWQGHLLAALSDRFPGAAALVVADNRHGVLAEALIPQLLAVAGRVKVPVYVDSQVTAARSSNHRLYRGASVVCLNEREAKAVTPVFDAARPEIGLRKIRDKISAEVIVVKLGKDGSVAWVQERLIKTPAPVVASVDSTGAGDAFIAALAAAHGAPWEKVLAFANRWAALSTTVAGPNPPTLEQLRSMKHEA